MARRKNESAKISDEEIFEQATAEDDPEAEAKEDQVTQEAQQSEEAPAVEPETETETKPESEQVKAEEEQEKPTHHVPLSELLNEREKRQNEQRQREALQNQLLQLQYALQQQQQPEEKPDVISDPTAWEKTYTDQMQRKFREMEGNFSMRLAANKYGEDFTNAWSEMAKRINTGDDSVRQQVVASSDPGETLVQWYKRERLASEVGDPAAFREKIQKEALEAALKDPEFLAQAMEAARQAASGQPSKTKLPPSLNKATGTSGNTEKAGDMSDRSLYDFATEAK